MYVCTSVYTHTYVDTWSISYVLIVFFVKILISSGDPGFLTLAGCCSSQITNNKNKNFSAIFRAHQCHFFCWFWFFTILCQDSKLQLDSPVNTTRGTSRQHYIYFDGLYAWRQQRLSLSITDGMIDTGNGAWDWRWLPCVCLLAWGRVVFPSLDRPVRAACWPCRDPSNTITRPRHRRRLLMPVSDASSCAELRGFANASHPPRTGFSTQRNSHWLKGDQERDLSAPLTWLRMLSRGQSNRATCLVQWLKILINAVIFFNEPLIFPFFFFLFVHANVSTRYYESCVINCF